MFYNNFIRMCNSIDKSPSAVAEEIGIYKSTVSNWKKRKTTPTDATLRKIADYFGVSVEYLLTGENEKPATISDDGFSEVDEVFRKLSPENREKLLELARLYLDAQHNQ